MKWKVLAATVAILSILAWVHLDGVHRGELKGKLEVTTLTGQLAEAKAKAKTALIEHQRQLDAQASEMTNVHIQEMGDLQRTLTVSRDATERLQRETTDLQRRLRNQPGIATSTGFQLSPSTKAAMVLSELFDGCSRERSELARAYDDSYARGIGVERKYDALRAILNKAP